MTREKKIISTSLVGILGNVLLVTAKAIIGIIAGSVAVILDAVNNLTDALSSVITIIGTKIAGKKPDKNHPFGHGRVEYITSLIIAVIILVAGGSAIYESILSLIEGTTPVYTNTSLIIISVAILVKIGLGLFFRKVGKEVQSDALIGSGIDALFDALLSLSTLIGAIVAMFAHVSIEGYLGILIGLFIIKSGVGVLKGSLANIIGTRTSKEISLAIKKQVVSHPEVKGAYDLILNNYGPNRAIGSIHIEVDDNLTAKEIHPLTRKISEEIYMQFGVILTVGIYASNSQHPEAREMRQFIYSLVKEYKDIVEIHGFYIDIEKKTASFDIIVDFKSDAFKIQEELKEKISARYPDYSLYIVLDTDFTD